MSKPKPRIGIFVLMQDGAPWQYAEARTLALALDIAIDLHNLPRWVDRHRDDRQGRLFDYGRAVWIAPALSIGKQLPPLPRIGPCEGDPLGLWFLEYRDRSRLHGGIFRRYFADIDEATAALEAEKGKP